MPSAARGSAGGASSPWQAGAGAEYAFASLWTTGDDTSLDRVIRIHALRRGPGGGWEHFDRFCAPEGDCEEVLLAARGRGVEPSAFEGAGDAATAWRDFELFLGSRTAVVVSSDVFRSWSRHLRAREGPDFDSAEPDVLGLDDLASLWPAARAGAAPSGAWLAEDVRRAVREHVARFLALPPRMQSLAAAALLACWRKLADDAEAARARLERALGLVDRPSTAFDAGEAPPDGMLTLAADFDVEEAGDSLRNGVDEVRPRWAALGDEWRELGTIPVASESAAPLDADELACVDRVFTEHLPARFAAAGAPSYRKGQHEVAARIARTFGERKLLLVHAPTGTGKTLSYLVPALLWSTRRNLRIAISTYTRALQEQCVDQELPRAAAALAAAGHDASARVTVLKGRANSLCWRALRLQVPSDDDGAEAWLAWTRLFLFSALDDDGDLDRFVSRGALSADANGSEKRALEALVRAVRAQVGCCRSRADRETCAAEVARQRAERSHVIVTNHAFALIRPTYFKHVVFDECEHLHDQAGGAWSFTVTLREIREFLARVRQPGRPSSRAPLDRLERLLLEGDTAWNALEASKAAWFGSLGALEALEASIQTFKAWRDREQRKREARDQHSLLREYVGAIGGPSDAASGAAELVSSHRKLCQAGTELDASLSLLAGSLQSPIQGANLGGSARVRRQIELARGDLLEWREALEAWIPCKDGAPAFTPERFHDLEQDSRGDDLLAARVLLPNELLGRSYYPALESAVLISATTWLRGGFETSMGYLGLDRATQPLEGEEREPSVVETFRSEDPFDYGRVLVCAPTDAPDPSRSREEFQAYVRRFLAHLGERTRGRMLALFTSADEARRTGEELAGFFRARGIPLWFQNMSGVRKEELGRRFRERVDSCLFGVDTFWYGADFPGETLEYLVIVKLPYGVPDRYHHAQCAALGSAEQRRRIYLPRALAKLRQGFGRLMRRETDRGCVFVLDPRIAVGMHRQFLGVLPLASPIGRAAEEEWPRSGARLVVDRSDPCLAAAFEHMGIAAEISRRGLETPFGPDPRASTVREDAAPRLERELLDVAQEDVPF